MNDFVANVSHELRTPLTVLRGFAETLQNFPDLPPKMRREITEKIVHTCHRLDKLVNALLALGDNENLSDDRLRPCNLHQLFEQCTHLLITSHPEVKLTIQIDCNQVIADPDLLDLAIMNLLENAVRYSSSPAEIEISSKEVEKSVHLCIKDRGIGISESHLPHIFDRFYAVDKVRSRKLGGVGLGLSIVKTIVEKHKGHVFVISEIDKGSAFTLALPSSTNEEDRRFF